MASGTLLSRLTGFARVIAVTTVLGVNGVSDAYNYANAVPNIIYDLLLGGILSATLVPVFVEQLGRRNRDEADRAVSAVLTAITVALLAITAVLFLAAPAIIHFYLLLDHRASAADERALGTSLLRLFAPQVFFLGAIVVSTALLNARRRFAAAAYSPVINNLIAVAAIVATDLAARSLNLGLFRSDHRAIAILGVGTTLGYVVQFLVQIPAMARSGLRVRWVWAPRHPAVRRVLGLSAWLIGVVVANQVSLQVILLIAGRRAGDVTAYQTAYQFFQLPYALFTVSLASAITPDLAARWSAGDRLQFQRRMIGSTRLTLAVLVPAAIGYAVVAGPLIDLAVRHGHVGASGAHLVGTTLAYFAVGLPGFSAFVLLMRAYQAMQDTRTMFVLYALENALTLVVALVLYPSLGVGGLALGWAVPYTVVAVVAAVHLARRLGTMGGALTIRSLSRILLAGAVTLLVLLAVRRLLPGGSGDVDLVLKLVVEVAVGGATYLGMATALGIEELDVLIRPLTRRRA